MAKSKKFIIVQSESVANQLVANGFILLSNNCGIYTFVNNAQENFTFNMFDVKELHFTDKLHL